MIHFAFSHSCHPYFQPVYYCSDLVPSSLGPSSLCPYRRCHHQLGYPWLPPYRYPTPSALSYRSCCLRLCTICHCYYCYLHCHSCSSLDSSGWDSACSAVVTILYHRSWCPSDLNPSESCLHSGNFAVHGPAARWSWCFGSCSVSGCLPHQHFSLASPMCSA